MAQRRLLSGFQLPKQPWQKGANHAAHRGASADRDTCITGLMCSRPYKATGKWLLVHWLGQRGGFPSIHFAQPFPNDSVQKRHPARKLNVAWPFCWKGALLCMGLMVGRYPSFGARPMQGPRHVPQLRATRCLVAKSMFKCLAQSGLPCPFHNLS